MNLQFLKRRSVHVFAATLIVIFVIALIAMPYGISYGVKQWILANGHDRVSVENVDFNPFTGDLAIYNLSANRSNNPPLVIKELELHFIWHKLWHKQLVFEGISVHGVDLVIEQSKTGEVRIGGIMSDPQAQTMNTEETKIPWGVAIEFLELRDVGIEYRMPTLNTQLQIKEFQLSHLASFVPDQQARLNLNGQLDGADLALTGILRPFNDTPDFQGKLIMAGMKLEKYSALLPSTISQLQATSNLSTEFDIQYLSAGQLAASLTGEISLQGITLAMASGRFASKDMHWKGQANFSSSGADHSVKADVSGDMSLQDITLAMESTLLESKGMHWKGQTNFSRKGADNPVELAVSGDFGLTRSRLTSNENLQLEQGNLTWTGKSDITLPAQGSIKVRVKGKTSSEQFHLIATDRDADLHYQRLTWDGSVDFNTDAAPEPFNLGATGELAIQTFKATSPGINFTLMAFDNLGINGINIQPPQSFSADRAEFNALLLGKQLANETDNGLASYGKLALDKVQYSRQEGLSISTIQLTDATQTIIKASDGQWNMVRLVDIIKSVAENKAEKEPENNGGTVDAGNDKDMSVRVGSINAAGNSTIIFQDLQADPVFYQEIKLKKATLSQLDTDKPSQASPVELSGVIGKRSDFSFAGVVSPFAKQLTMDIKGQLDGFPLPTLSSYSTNLLGYSLVSGGLDARMSFKADKGKLNGQNELDLNQLTVSPVGSAETKKLEARLGIPLEAGLSLLRDKHNNIKLKLPITGDVENFKVDASDVISQALAKAMKQAAKTYLLGALFPYGTLITIVEMAGDKAMQIKLNPIIYEPGSSSLTAEHKEYLAKVSTILKERPEIHIKFCGVSTQADHEYLLQKANTTADGKPVPSDRKIVSIADEQLNLLAQQRADMIEAFLIQEYKVKTTRLISCQARIEKEDAQSKPRTDLLL